MTTKDYLNDITEIKNMMSKSSRFISLSGLSGILAGIYALIGATIAYILIDSYFLEMATTYDNNYNAMRSAPHDLSLRILQIKLIAIAISVILAASITGIILTIKKATRNNEKIWDTSSRRLLINFLIPLVTGGLLCLVILQRGYISLIAPTMLIFYGLACISASKFTIGDVKYLGLTLVILGLISTQFVGYGLYFWAFGFGVMHIFYGSMMHFKYDSKN